MRTETDRNFFKNLLWIVLIFVLGYSGVYFFLGAYFVAVCLFLGGLVFTPLTIFLENRGHFTSARLFFICSSVFYVYSSPLGIQLPISAEFYFIPGMMIGHMLFDPRQKVAITVGMLIPLLGWGLTRFGPMPSLSAGWMPTNFPVELFRVLNFLGASVITGLFLRVYGTHVLKMQSLISDELEHANSMARLLDESQKKAKLGSWEWDIKTNKVTWSKQQYELFECDPKMSVSFETYLRFLSSVDRVATRELIDQALKGKSEYNVEHEVHLPSGRKTLHESGIVEFNDEGQPVRMWGTSQDISERKKNEMVLKRNTDLLEASQSIGRLGGWDLTIATGELFWTAETYRIHETSPAEFNPTVDAGVGYFLPESRRIISEALRLAVEKGQGYDLELETYTTKGSQITVRTTCEVVFENDTPVRLRGIFQDITQQKAIAAELNKARERLEIAIDAVQFGIWDWDVKADFLDWDINMYRIYQLEKANFASHSDAFEKSLVPGDAIRLKDEYKSAFLNNKSVFESEFQILDSNGQFKYIRSVARCLYDKNGTIERVVGANWDVTTAKKSEASLVASAKMASLGEMAGGIAHEINNPLAIIQGKAGTVKRLIRQPPFDIEKINIELSKIEDTTNRIAKIIKGLRSFSRDSTSDPMIATSVRQIIEDCLELCAERFKNHSIELQRECKVDSIVECRASQIGQVIMNLLSNAHDAVESLSERWVKVEVSRVGDQLRVAVTDSGRGIPKEVVDKIMQPFFTTKEVGRGTGLGLSISKGIAESHSGELRYDSTCDNTRFILEIPLRQPVYFSS